jgi:hypothetical protein
MERASLTTRVCVKKAGMASCVIKVSDQETDCGGKDISVADYYAMKTHNKHR